MSILDFVLGRRLASSENNSRKIGVLAALPAMGLDGLSSCAYGPEAALTLLMPLGTAGLLYIGPITIAIVILLTILYMSYRQTIAAYPANGGSYTVARENLGVWASLFAAAALMIDYVLTVAVGISAGVAALISAAPHLHKLTVPLCLIMLAVITLLNLRGTGEAGMAFALPTYLFIASLGWVLILGIIHAFGSAGHPHPIVAPPAIPAAVEGVGIWLLLRSFASGCTAMTGVEAVSNGVSAFKEPTIKNAHWTLTAIVAILVVLLVSIAYLSRVYHIGAMDQNGANYQSVLSQLTAAIVGRGWFYYMTIASVLAVLCLSANTSFVDFPRLCRLIAKDQFLPLAFANFGRRLINSVGIVFLAMAAGVLLVAFDGITDKLIPLFAVGAFLAFTLSQTGMVMHWITRLRATRPRKESALGIHARLWINGIGAVATGIALAIIVFAKFVEGAWITILAIPVLLSLFRMVHRHYAKVQEELVYQLPLDVLHLEPPVAVVPIRRWDRLTVKSLRFAMYLSTEVIALHLSNLDGEAAKNETARVRQEWATGVEAPARSAGLAPPRLEIVQTPYREFSEPLLKAIDQIKNRYPNRMVAVIVPELVGKHWWDALLHTRRAAELRSALRKREDQQVVVIDLPWFIKD